MFQSDWDSESCKLINHFKNTLIQHWIACPHTHKQMGAIEWLHKQILKVGLSLLSHAHLPEQFWEDSFVTTVYWINWHLTPVLQNKSSYEIVYHSKPNYRFLKVFGCVCWPYLCPFNKYKIDFRLKTCIFIGYGPNRHGYKCLDLTSGKIYVTRHVIFDEKSFPGFTATQNRVHPHLQYGYFVHFHYTLLAFFYFAICRYLANFIISSKNLFSTINIWSTTWWGSFL